MTSIHLVYVRIPGKGITLHRLLQGDDDNSEIGIGNVLSGNNHGWFYEILNGGWKRKWFLVVEGEKVPNENQKGEVNKI